MSEDKIYPRFLEEAAFSPEMGRQMRFIAGPRQCGKTTIAKHQLEKVNSSLLYYNWDKKSVRKRFREESSFLENDLINMGSKNHYWVCFDEIHKMPRWKNILKDFFDTYENKVTYIVTGSARLDLFRRAGDSLAGRYFLFRLNPFILSEILKKPVKNILPEKDGQLTIEKFISFPNYYQTELEQLLHFSGFPEPFLSNNALFAKKWQQDYFERIIKEDLRDISHIHMLEKVLDLLYLLPIKIGSPLSLNSLRQDLDVHVNTIKNYIRYLVLSYVLFEISPYYQKKSRLVKKEKKVYFYNWLDLTDEAKRFENYVAFELKSRVDLWNDLLVENYELFFVRSRDGGESDFLITKNKQPFLLCEAKLSDKEIAQHHYRHREFLNNVPFVQIIKEPNILSAKTKGMYIVSASRFFA